MATMERIETLALIEHEVGSLARRIRQVLSVRSRSVHPDLLPACYLVLVHVASNGPVRATDVVEFFGMDKGAISRQIAQLVDLGLLEKLRDRKDRRAWLLSATPTARERLETVSQDRRRYLADRLDGWTTDDLVSFSTLLARFNASLD